MKLKTDKRYQKAIKEAKEEASEQIVEELEVSFKWNKKKRFEATKTGAILLEDNKPIMELTICSDGLLIKQTKTTIVKYEDKEGKTS